MTVKSNIFDVCTQHNVILPLPSGTDKNYLILKLVQKYVNENLNKKIVFVSKTHQSSTLFVNVLKAYTVFDVTEARFLHDLKGNEEIISIPPSQNQLEIVSSIQNSIKLLILADLHKDINEIDCQIAQLLEHVRNNSPNCRIIGFTIPVQTVKFAIDYRQSRDFIEDVAQKFKLPVRVDLELQKSFNCYELPSITFREFHLFENRFQEMQNSFQTALNYDNFVQGNKWILSTFYSFQNEFNLSWECLHIKKYNEIRILEPIEFMKAFGNILDILKDFGEICALKAIQFYWVEVENFFTLFEPYPNHKYLAFLRKILTSLRQIKNAILFYLPAEIRKKIQNQQNFTLQEFMALSTSRLNGLVEEFVQEFETQSFTGQTIIVTKTSAAAKVVSQWINDLASLVKSEIPSNPFSRFESVYYIADPKEKFVNSRFVNDVFFYRQRVDALKSFQNVKNGRLNILVTNASQLPSIRCDRLVTLSLPKTLLSFVSLKEFLRNSTSKFTVISDEKNALKLLEDFTEQEQFYFNRSNKATVVHQPVVTGLTNVLIKSMKNANILVETPPEAVPTEDFKISSPPKAAREFSFPNIVPNFPETFVKPGKEYLVEHLYEIVLKDQNSRKLAFIVPRQLGELCSFEVFHRHGNHVVQFKKIDVKIQLSTQQVDSMLQFNEYAYKDILNFDVNTDFQKYAFGKLLVMPLCTNGRNFDWDLIKNCLTKELSSPSATFRAERFTDAIITPMNRPHMLYLVKNIDSTKTPMTALDSDAFSSFSHYYKGVYGRSVTNKKSPLVEVEKLNLNLPKIEPQVFLTDSKTFFIVPEFYRIHSLPFSLFFKIQCLPSVVHVLFAQLNTKNLQERIRDELKLAKIKIEQDNGSYELNLRQRDGEESDIPDMYDRNFNFFDDNSWTEGTRPELIDGVDQDFDENILSDILNKSIFNLETLNENQLDDWDDDVIGDEQEEEEKQEETSYLETEGLNDKTYKMYKRRAFVYDFLGFELLLPQSTFEDMIEESFECKAENALSTATNNFTIYLDRLIRYVNIDEECELRSITYDRYANQDEENQDYSFFDPACLSDMCTTINQNTENFNNLIDRTLQAAIYHEYEDDDFDTYIGSNAKDEYVKYFITEMIPPIQFEHLPDFKNLFETQDRLAPIVEPKIVDLLQSFQMAGIHKFKDLENFAILGQTFIKFIMTTVLFCENEDLDYSQLDLMVQEQTSIARLAKMGIDSGLVQLLRVHLFNPTIEWSPPGFVRKDAPSEHLVAENRVAQAVQATIGIHLKSCGQKVALQLMKLFGFEFLDGKDVSRVKQHSLAGVIYAPMFPVKDHELGRHLYQTRQLEKLEQILSHNFNDKFILIQALTHPSNNVGAVQDDQHKLSLLGEHLLSYLFVRCVFSLENVDPDIRNHCYHLITGNYYASVACMYDIQKYIFFDSNELFKSIDVILRSSNESIAQGDEQLVTDPLFGPGESDKPELIEVSDVLIDTVRALAGAVYLDSNFSLEIVWKSFAPLLFSQIEYFKQNLLINPYEELNINQRHRITVETVTQLDDGRFEAEIHLYKIGRFVTRAETEYRALNICAKKVNRLCMTESSPDLGGEGAGPIDNDTQNEQQQDF